MDNYEGLSLEDLIKRLQDDVKLRYDVELGYGNISRKSSDLWEATIQTMDNTFSVKGEGNTQKEAFIDAFDKAKQALDPTE